MPKGKTEAIRVILTTEEFNLLKEEGRVFPFQRITRGNLEKFLGEHETLIDYPSSKLLVLTVS